MYLLIYLRIATNIKESEINVYSRMIVIEREELNNRFMRGVRSFLDLGRICV